MSLTKQMEAAVRAASYFVVPRAEIDAIPEHREPPAPLPEQASSVPPLSSVGRPRTGTHPRAAYWREYKRRRYHEDPVFRERHKASVKRTKQRGAR